MVKLEVISGSMFSGKSEEAMRRARRAGIKKVVLCVKPAIDTRTEAEIVARALGNDGKFSKATDKMPAVIIYDQKQFEELIAFVNPQVLVMDEVQFFPEWIVEAVRKLLFHTGGLSKIIAAGLPLDAWGRPFGSMPVIMAMADEILPQRATCFRCGKEDSGVMTYLKCDQTGEQIQVGSDQYEARCRACWTLPPPRPVDELLLGLPPKQ